MSYFYTYVVEYQDGHPPPRVGSDMTIEGGKLWGVTFANLQKEVDMLRELASPEALEKVDAMLVADWRAQRWSTP